MNYIWIMWIINLFLLYRKTSEWWLFLGMFIIFYILQSVCHFTSTWIGWLVWNGEEWHLGAGERDVLHLKETKYKLELDISNITSHGSYFFLMFVFECCFHSNKGSSERKKKKPLIWILTFSYIYWLSVLITFLETQSTFNSNILGIHHSVSNMSTVRESLFLLLVTVFACVISFITEYKIMEHSFGHWQ